MGGVAATAVGLLVAGPPGAIAGAVAGPIVEQTALRLASEFKHRQLGEREVQRIGGAMAVAVTRIDQRLKEGAELRRDGFFEAEGLERAAASEIGEGVLLAAQREHEEKKVPLLGNLLASLAFQPEVGRAQANLLLRLGRELSYQQLCVLTLLGNNRLVYDKQLTLDPHKDLGLRDRAYLSDGGDDGFPSLDHESLMLEIDDLGNRNLIAGTKTWGGFGYATPSALRIQGAGLQLWVLMGLSTIEKDDVERVRILLQ